MMHPTGIIEYSQNGLYENQESCTIADSLELGIKKVRAVHFRALILAERIAILTNFISNGQWLWSLFVNMIPINSSITSARSIPFIIVLLFIFDHLCKYPVRN